MDEVRGQLYNVWNANTARTKCAAVVKRFGHKICRSGGGKSQDYSNFFGNPLKEIEQSKRLQQLVFQDFTSSGLMRAIKDARQHLIWASDEFGAGLTHALNPKDNEWRGFWATLNSFYSGTGSSKNYAQKAETTSDSVFFFYLWSYTTSTILFDSRKARFH
uniref:Uncharacterized protein n=1 Tax=Romanomermis culicivorax TaxID=13658 RepID=A0A915JWD3_ROMCU